MYNKSTIIIEKPCSDLDEIMRGLDDLDPNTILAKKHIRPSIRISLMENNERKKSIMEQKAKADEELKIEKKPSLVESL